MVRLMAEAYRLRLLHGLEDRLYECGHGCVAGVDEAGRGALAGPVMAAAVLVTPDLTVPGVDDSKAVRADLRERLAHRIRAAHPVYAVVSIPPDEIDRINILEATRRAMTRALESLDPSPEIALVDAVRLPAAPCPHLPLIRGDQISYAVACASILAKTARDQEMVRLHRRFPHYDFASNKGYGAQKHRDALRFHGPCSEHRLTFRSVVPRCSTGKPSRRSGKTRGGRA